MKLKDFLKQLNDAINSNPYITEMEIEYIDIISDDINIAVDIINNKLEIY
jgi:hypothetical protein